MYFAVGVVVACLSATAKAYHIHQHMSVPEFQLREKLQNSGGSYVCFTIFINFSFLCFFCDIKHLFENTQEYAQLVAHMKLNDPYIRQLMADAEVDFDGLIKLKQEQYLSSIGEKISESDAIAEIVADAIGNEFFTDYDALYQLATQNRSAFTKFKQWFLRTSAKLQATKMSESKAMKQTKKLLLRAEQAAKKSTQTNNDTKFMIDKSFSVKLDSWVNNDAQNPSIVFNIGRTSKILKSIGLADVPITWDSSKIIKILSKHPEMTFETIKEVPKILESPILVMQSKQIKSRITMFGEVFVNDKPVLAVLELSPTNRKGIALDEFKVASAYGKDNAQNLINSSDILFQETDKKRVSEWEKLTGLQLPVGISSANSNNSIPTSPENVKNSAKKSEVVKAIAEDYGFTDTSAQKLVSVAASMRKTAGSKADLNELSLNIANAVMCYTFVTLCHGFGRYNSPTELIKRAATKK